MILSAATLRRLQPVSPFCERTVHRGMSYGLSLAGYDVRAKIKYAGRTLVGSCGAILCDDNGESCLLRPGGFMLVSTLEYFTMPVNVVAFVHDKSTWARRGVSIPPVVLEPGWKGHLTLALRNLGPECVTVWDGGPIAQIVFHELDSNCGPGYTGKYQGQGAEPVPARTED